MSILTIVSHAPSVYNLENRFTGTIDIDLPSFVEDEGRQSGEKL